MILSLSERKTTALIQQLEGTDETIEEISYNMKRYGTRLFQHVNEAYQLEYAGMTNLSGGIADFRFNINCGRDLATNDFNWESFLGGLAFLNPLGVTLERDDIWKTCDPLIGKSLYSAWADVRQNFERLSVAEVRPTLEAWLAHLAFNGHGQDQKVIQMAAKQVFETNELGLADPMAHHREVEEYRRREIEEANQPATNWGVIDPTDGTRY